MNERASARNAKAEAARVNRKLVRARSRRRVAFSSFALFALVFTLLSFRLTTGLDPSSSGDSVAAASAPSDSSSSVDQSAPADSTTPAAPTTSAS